MNSSQSELRKEKRMTTNERVLKSWIHMLMSVNGEHAVSTLPYNEAVICNVLIHADKEITATDLCNVMKMQKSQMNRTLTSMEAKGMIRRIRSESDKRQIIIKFIDEADNPYHSEHEKILKYVDRLLEHFGVENIENMIDLFDYISKIAQENNE